MGREVTVADARRLLDAGASADQVKRETGLTLKDLSAIVVSRTPMPAPQCRVCEDVAFLVDAGERREVIAGRVGLTVPALEQHAQRHRLRLPPPLGRVGDPAGRVSGNGGAAQPATAGAPPMDAARHAVRLLLQRSDLPARAATKLRAASAALDAADELIRADAGKAALRRQIAETEAELRRLRAQLRGGGGAVTRAPQQPGGPDRAAIRAWAQANGHPCPTRGRIPQKVVAAYHAAHGDGS